MSTAVVYCTAEIPLSAINGFLTSSSNDDDGVAWALAASSDLPLDKLSETKPPLSEFQSDGFHQWTKEQLQKHHESHLSQPVGFLSESTFAELDSSSVDDGTVVLHHLVITWPQEQIETADPDPDKMIRYWLRVKCAWEKARMAVALLETQDSEVVEDINAGKAIDELGTLEKI